MLKYITHHLKRSKFYNDFLGYRAINDYSLSPFEDYFTTHQNIKSCKSAALIGIPFTEIDYSKDFHKNESILNILQILSNNSVDYAWHIAKITIEDAITNAGYVWLFIGVDDPNMLVYLKMRMSEIERFKHVELQG